MNKNRMLHSAPVSGRSLWTMFAIALVVLLSSQVLLASSPQGSFEKTLQVNGPVTLEALTHSGDITVKAGSQGSVTIRGKIYVGNSWFSSSRDSDVHEIEQHPPIRQDGNTIHIDYVNMHNIAINYEITVPEQTTLRTHSGSGDQVIEGTKGNVETETGSGDVRLENLTGEIHLHTGSGNIRARQIAGSVRGSTGSGDVEIVETSSGDIEVHTGSGNITARGIQGGFHGEAGSGDITAEGKQSRDWEIHTGSGNVNIRLPENSAFDADISTSSGTIEVNSPIEMTVQGRINESHRQIHGKVHGGGPLLRVRTGSGDIHIS